MTSVILTVKSYCCNVLTVLKKVRDKFCEKTPPSARGLALHGGFAIGGAVMKSINYTEQVFVHALM